MKLLAFLSRRFSILKRIPGLPQALDGVFLLWMFISFPRFLTYLDEITKAVRSWANTSIHIHRFGGTEYRVAGREIGHLHGNGILDVRLHKRSRDHVVNQEIALPHHTFPASNWVSLRIQSQLDVETAINLLGLAAGRREIDLSVRVERSL